LRSGDFIEKKKNERKRSGVEVYLWNPELGGYPNKPWSNGKRN